ncbi:hypothetical protein D3C87_1428140 [compost metagenome]
MVDAFHRHAGLRSRGTGSLRPGADDPVLPAGRRRVQPRLPDRRGSRGPPPHGSGGPGHGGQHLRHALCRHGGVADAGVPDLCARTGRPVGGRRPVRLDRRPVRRRAGPLAPVAVDGGAGSGTGRGRDAPCRHGRPDGDADPDHRVARSAGRSAPDTGRRRGGGDHPHPVSGAGGRHGRSARQADRHHRRRGCRLLGDEPAAPDAVDF